MFRIGLFLLTNLAVLVMASITLNLLGVGHYFEANGSDLNLTNLLNFCAVFGFSGSFISLFLSIFMAKRGTGTQVITQPQTAEQQSSMPDSIYAFGISGGFEERFSDLFASHPPLEQRIATLRAQA